MTLDTNVGHGPALDLGWLRARTQTVVALDVDAFPISDSVAVTPDDTARRGWRHVVGAHGGEVLERLSAMSA